MASSTTFTAKNSDMEFRFLGNTGLLVSALSFGAWLTFQGEDEKAVEENSYRMMKTAIKNGANFFDNAETYGNGQAEVIMGRVLKRLFAEGVVKRQHLVITTKIYWGDESVPNMHGLSRKHIMEAMNSSLERFQLPYVDVVFAHRPDKYTPLEETVRAFSDLITQGKAFYWGTSEWPADMITEAYHIAKRLNLHAPVAEQPQYSMIIRNRVENEYERLINTEMKMGLTVWSPLASGLLSGKYTSLANEEALPADSRLGSNPMVRGFVFKKDNSVTHEVRDRTHLEEIIAGLRPIAERLGATVPQLALAWVLKNKGVSTVITGASKPEQIEENFKAIGVYRKLTDADMEEIEKLLGNNPRNNPQKVMWQSARHAWSPMVFPAKPIQ